MGGVEVRMRVSRAYKTYAARLGTGVRSDLSCQVESQYPGGKKMLYGSLGVFGILEISASREGHPQSTETDGACRLADASKVSGSDH